MRDGNSKHTSGLKTWQDALEKELEEPLSSPLWVWCPCAAEASAVVKHIVCIIERGGLYLLHRWSHLQQMKNFLYVVLSRSHVCVGIVASRKGRFGVEAVRAVVFKTWCQVSLWGGLTGTHWNLNVSVRSSFQDGWAEDLRPNPSAWA